MRCGIGDWTDIRWCFSSAAMAAPTRELTSSNAPLRGEKGDVYEGGFCVPFSFPQIRSHPSNRSRRRMHQRHARHSTLPIK